MRRRVAVPATLAALAALVAGAAAFDWRPASSSSVPTTRIKKGSLALDVYTMGELKPGKSAMLLAPSVGGTLQIVSIKPSGAKVEAKDLVVEFDPSEQEYNLEQAKSEVDEVEQQLIKEKADASIQESQDQVALTHARFEVRRAELEVGKNELVSAIDAKKNDMALKEAKRALDQLEQDIQSRATSSRARIVVLEEKRQKSKLKMTQAEKAIEDMKVTTAVPGFVSILENRSGGWTPPGMSLPEYRAGDLVQSGAQLALVAQPDSMEILTKVDEADRTSIEAGQPVEVYCEGLSAGVVLTGKVKRVASVPSRANWWQMGNKKFDMVVELTKRDERLRSGQTALVKVRAKELKDVLQVPRQAVFEKEGKSVVYVRAGGAFSPKEVKVLLRSESTAALEGVAEGTEVALADPEGPKGGGRRKPDAAAMAGGPQ
jgi:HlyD family secretion protein